MKNIENDKNPKLNETPGPVVRLAPEPDLEVEKALLGTLLIYGAQDFADVLDVGLLPQHFFRDSHAEIFAAIADLFNQNEPVDNITLSEKLRARKTLTMVGGVSYLVELQGVALTLHSIRSYAKIIVDRAMLRRLMVVAASVTEKCQSTPHSVEEVLDEAEAQIFGIRDSRPEGSLIYVPDSLDSVVDFIFEVHDSKSGLSGVPTGFKKMDRLTGGFQKTDLIILGGRPGMGKTSLALNFALNVACPARRQVYRDFPPYSVLIFSLEMGRDQILMRLLCQMGEHDLLDMRTGRFSSQELRKLSDSAENLKRASIFVDDSSGGKLRPLDVRAKARRLKRQLKALGQPELGLIVVDYLQLLTPNNERHNNREREVAELSSSLKNLAKELDLTVLCCSQLKRSDVGKPDLADLRDSGAIEQDADIVAFVLREEVIHPDKPELQGKAELQIKKHRNGPTGVVHMTFLKHCSSFVPAAFEEYLDPNSGGGK
ncbi:MAG: replicative DNA helicase [Deltaproteobacteria bacterium]|jgi:replicative DNA helicase|nr:replicative DNA helicase [Deltaproteobacteria bacterium]